MSTTRKRFDIRRATKPLVIVLALCFVLDLGFYLIFVRPDRQRLDSLQRGTAPQFMALEEQRKRIEDLEAFLDGLNQAEADMKYFREELLSTREQRMIEVQDEVSRLCAEFNVDYSSVTYDNEPLPAEGLERFRQVVPLQGGYQALRRFLQAVENSDKFLVITQVVLGQTGRDGRMLELDITLDTFFDAPVQPPARNGARTNGTRS